MARLTALKVYKAKQPGMYGDGGGLYLRVSKEGTKYWVFRFMLNGRPRWMGIGPLSLYGLQEAREKALDARRLRHAAIDPIDARRAVRAQERIEAAKSMTFKQVAAEAQKHGSVIIGRASVDPPWPGGAFAAGGVGGIVQGTFLKSKKFSRSG